MEKLEGLMKPLPLKERDVLYKQVRAYKRALGKLEELKSKAFGIKVAVMEESINGFTTKKVFDERTAQLITLFGKMHTVNEIHEIINVDWGYPVTKTQLQAFKKKWQTKIADERALWQHDLSHLQLAHKPARVDLMTSAVKHYERSWKMTGSQKDYDNMLKAFDRIQKEFSRTELDINANINHSFENTIQPHIATEIMGGMSINEIIVCRVAHQLKVSPLYILQKLQASYYAKFTGFGDNNNAEQIKEMVPDSPHTTAYDWGKLKEMDANGDIEEINYIELKDEPIKEDVVPEEDVRKMIKEALAKRSKG